MAEVIALSASLAGVLQLVGYGYKFARTLTKFSQQVGSGSDEIDRFTAQVQFFSQTVGLAQVSLSRHVADYEESPVITYIRAHHVLDDLSTESKVVEQRLRVARHWILSMRHQHKIVVVLKWIWRKRSIMQLCPLMESIKTSMALIMSTAHFEVTQLRLLKTPADAVEETERLRNEMSV